MAKSSIEQDEEIGRAFELCDSMLLEEGGSPPLEPDEGEEEPVDPIGDKGEQIAMLNIEYAKAIDELKGAQVYIDGIWSWTDKGEAKVLLAKAKERAKSGLKAMKEVVSKLEKLKT